MLTWVSAQTRRGGRVKLQSILLPETEFNHKEKGEALYAMELSLSLEKLNFQKLLALHKIAADAEDAQLTDFVGAPLLHTASPEAHVIVPIYTFIYLPLGFRVWGFFETLFTQYLFVL